MHAEVTELHFDLLYICLIYLLFLKCFFLIKKQTFVIKFQI